MSEEDSFVCDCLSSSDTSPSSSLPCSQSCAIFQKRSRLSAHPQDDQAELFNVFHVNDGCSLGSRLGLVGLAHITDSWATEGKITVCANPRRVQHKERLSLICIRMDPMTYLQEVEATSAIPWGVRPSVVACGDRIIPHARTKTNKPETRISRFHSEFVSDDESLHQPTDSCEIFSQFNWDLHVGDDDEAIDPTNAASKKFPAIFRWSGQGAEVAISGSFNNWRSKIPLVKSESDFYTIIDISSGTHQYKYFVDGEWVCHPNEPTVNNEVGTKNNVVSINEEDCDIYRVLNSDSLGSTYVDPSSSPPGTYNQFIPSGDVSLGFRRFGPPLLPPQLLDTVLNKDVSATCEPMMVPEPGHVVLNHLYTLSIKGGVMVLSSTHRYRKKYITTLLYKPI